MGGALELSVPVFKPGDLIMCSADHVAEHELGANRFYKVDSYFPEMYVGALDRMWPACVTFHDAGDTYYTAPGIAHAWRFKLVQVYGITPFYVDKSVSVVTTGVI